MESTIVGSRRQTAIIPITLDDGAVVEVIVRQRREPFALPITLDPETLPAAQHPHEELHV